MKSYTMTDGVVYAICSESRDKVRDLDGAEIYARGVWSLCQIGVYGIQIKEFDGIGRDAKFIAQRNITLQIHK